MRCFARACLGGAEARALAFRSLGLVVCRAVDVLAILRAGDFFCAAERAAARDVGFCLAIPCLPDSGRTRLPEAPPEQVSRSSAMRQTNFAARKLRYIRPSAAGTRHPPREVRQA